MTTPSRRLRNEMDEATMANEAVRARVGPSAPLEGIAFRVLHAAPDAEAAARALARELLGAACAVVPLGRDTCTFTAVPSGPLRTLGAAWDHAARLATFPDVAWAEPVFAMPVPHWPDWHDTPARRPAARRTADLAAAAQDASWAVRQVRAGEAWRMLADRGRGTGEGVRIALPDTGFVPHPAVWEGDPVVGCLVTSEGLDFVASVAADAVIPDASVPHAARGTSLASVIVGRGDGSASVAGVAPGASVVPLRVTAEPGVFAPGRLAQAIHHAVERGCDVISVALGGLESRAVREAVRRATGCGVVVVAAAGDFLHAVPYPAGYEEVVAVAASNAGRRVFTGSPYSRAVAIAAPGESVWRARARRVNGGGLAFGSGMGTGSAYAAAIVAGAAALWLAYHGRDDLAGRYGEAGVPRVFRHLLTTHGFDRPDGWEPEGYGAGILDCVRLLSAPLPAAVPEPRLGLPPVDTRAPVEALQLVVGPLEPERRLRLATLLLAHDRRFDDAVRRVGSELATHLLLLPVLRQALTAGTPRERSVDLVRGTLLAGGVSRHLEAVLTGWA